MNRLTDNKIVLVTRPTRLAELVIRFNTVSQARCQGASHPVVAPGTGWNVVTVGGVDDRGTTGWRDDRLYRDTCDGDPAGGTFKPEISAPAVRIRVNRSDHTGTSFAAPQVAGGRGVIPG